jgi:hypothetical protein
VSIFFFLFLICNFLSSFSVAECARLFCDIWNSGVYMFWGFCLVCYLQANGCLIVEFWEIIFFFSWSAMSHHCSWLLNVQGCFCMLAIVRWCLEMFHDFNKLVDKNAFSQLWSLIIWGMKWGSLLVCFQVGWDGCLAW